jgi:predicted RNase H-like nuclease
VAFVRPKGPEVRVRTERLFANVVDSPERPKVIAVDIPIGLPEHSELGGRAPEPLVRRLVGRRRSSVFRVPSRPAVYASIDRAIGDDGQRYRKGCAIARATSADKKAFAKQGFYLCPKIVEVDKLLRARTELLHMVFETHPELAFWRLNGQCPVPEPKKHKSGEKLRKRLLVEAGFPSQIVESNPPKGAQTDDLIDALVCAIVARRIHRNEAKRFPDRPKLDDFGLPMAIWA